ncbi:MAG: hypothetical protein D6811_05130 [Alphaproteobacteria bacterium]|nr:MAG: hypothetical protein D6811_05130 [Alphaproteobacteria bacterium]
MSGLEDFVPETKVVEVGDRKVEVGPLKVGQLPGFGRAVAPLLRAAKAGDPLDIAIAEHAGSAIDAVVIATGIDRAFLEARHPDDLLVLVAAVIEVNADFFARRLAPTLAEAVSTMGAIRAAAIGTSSSPGSAAGDTGSGTSST